MAAAEELERGVRDASDDGSADALRRLTAELHELGSEFPHVAGRVEVARR